MKDEGQNPLQIPLSQLKGVTRDKADALVRLKLTTVGDLLWKRPRRYEDRRCLASIRDLKEGEYGSVRAVVKDMGVKSFRRGSKSLFELVLEDGTGKIRGRWWNMPFMGQYFSVGEEYFIYGKVAVGKPLAMDHPEIEPVQGDGSEDTLHLNRIVPIYRLTEGLTQRSVRQMVWGAWMMACAYLRDQEVEEDQPDLPRLAEAIEGLHFPAEMEDAEKARQRLAWRELFQFQKAMSLRRARWEAKAKAIPAPGDNRWVKPFLNGLSFELTEAQKKVLREIRMDLGGKTPMRRLLQGDVGSGKTVVAACASLMVLESGHCVVLMAPTEILARQHYQTFKAWFSSLNIPVGLWTRQIKEEIFPSMQPGIMVGTHAVLEEGFEVDQLGLVIIDEQHKFGVSQRDKLLRKGQYPHLLVMTATPIPRTLGLTLFCDLDFSIMDQMPSGRGLVRTYLRGPERLGKIYEFVRNQVSQGRQAYFVYPRVEEVEEKPRKAVKGELEKLAREFAPNRVALLHGQMTVEEKEEVMAGFRKNEISVLVSTTVIEVGVDIPNATLMVVENADTFGLAQLHQLRGRIGRGANEGHCILVSDLTKPEIRERLEVLVQNTDGFVIAEEDLKLRGPGDFLGTKQSGLPSFKYADLRGDYQLLVRAHRMAARKIRGEI